MINYSIELKQKKFRGFDRFSKFILIGNNIDGWVDIDIIKFDTFQEVIENMPSLLENFTCDGEWNLTFYQVPENYKILKRYGYYNYPSNGKVVFELTYDRFPLQRIKVYIDNSLIHFSLIDKEVVENWFIEDKDFLDLNFCEYYWSIHLLEKVPIKLIENHEFKLSPERYHKVIYGKDDEYF